MEILKRITTNSATINYASSQNLHLPCSRFQNDTEWLMSVYAIAIFGIDLPSYRWNEPTSQAYVSIPVLPNG